MAHGGGSHEGGQGVTTAAAPESLPPSPVQPGDIVGERYRVLREIGRGGMGLVVAAEHLQLPQQVAIKFLINAVDPRLRVRFSQEAATVVQLRSEHVCRVFDVGALPGGEPYMVMELLSGSDLEQVLRQRGPLPVADVVDYALQTCEALAEAHRMGVVHRDLKPSNLFLSQSVDGSAVVKVMDFGIAKASEAVSGHQGLTQSGATMGSPRFMAPEQLVSSRDVDARADIWALGVTLYELLTGYPAFSGTTLAEIHIAVLQHEPRRLAELRPDLPVSIEGAIAGCLAKDPAHRWPNVAALAAALEPTAPSHARRYIERVHRMVGVPSSVPAGSGDVVSASTVHAHAAQAPTAGGAIPYGATAPPAAGYPSAAGYPPAAGGAPFPGGQTTGPQMMPSGERTLPSAGAEQRRYGIYLGLSAGLLLCALAVFGVVYAMKDQTDEAIGKTCYFEKCDETVKIVPGKPFDPSDYVEKATLMAQALEPEAELSTVTFSGMRDGLFMDKLTSPVAFVFSYPVHGGSSSQITVAINGHMMMGRHVEAAGGLPTVPPPGCRFRKAFTAANQDGSFEDELVSGVYGVLPGKNVPGWTIMAKNGQVLRYVDGDCRVMDGLDLAR